MGEVAEDELGGVERAGVEVELGEEVEGVEVKEGRKGKRWRDLESRTNSEKKE